ncbi:chloride channel protein CLC-d [Arabidopsis lyrata subsp. lyrata]|uniref:chloride channel protein CLC-d n=1 Tax=Arabidopsis lyrata subsp. lyrata TaxID=81972 RepID=UPI000A29BED5|nr:chloride channel protein CLC-d [Arabidopsis lyrata subsp. lyrata]|eukprot:XP_020871419.1 chloride channel protein CLC-d [Arabidopsis lyrata subsp. lyrata]
MSYDFGEREREREREVRVDSEFVFHIYALDFAGFDIPGTFLFRTLIGKIFGSIGSVGGGLALGKEGPLVHTGAYIASLLGQGGSTKYHLNSRWQQFFKSDRDRRDLVTCGCAAGVAAAFRGGQIMVGSFSHILCPKWLNLLCT